jgi:hypothetical protein
MLVINLTAVWLSMSLGISLQKLIEFLERKGSSDDHEEELMTDPRVRRAMMELTRDREYMAWTAQCLQARK